METKGKAIHFFGPQSHKRQITFAAILSGLIAKYKKIDVIDTGLIAQKYFQKERPEQHFTNAPLVVVLGKEIEAKIGAFYFRQAIEYAAPRKLPMVLFTDYSVTHMGHRYPDFEELIKFGRFQSINLEELREIT